MDVGTMANTTSAVMNAYTAKETKQAEDTK